MLVVMLVLAGCGHSPPTRYVTLSAAPGEVPGEVAGGMRTISPLQLTAVHIPAELDRPEVVTQVAPNRLTIDDNVRWGAPLARMIRRTLAEDLVMRLPAGAFVFPDAPAPAGTRTLIVTVLSAQANAGATLKLEAAWSVLDRKQSGSATLMRQVKLETPIAGNDAVAQAAALSRILGMLADRIVVSVY
ncbi:PqiC family protein [Paraburkholderia sp. RG36]|uniref:PqiC family protein n=2 Tax=Paraburkholderia tagetis TaxID=2913261 RepID=A0A9X1UG85_9BURK|nr:PqiC family protein [Paraburkholderia tagetis]MCG5075384.1 PqiC family protein [Paraburkholderia tagetis]